MTIFAYNPVPKPSHKRHKPLARQRGAITPKVRAQLKERSGGICERGCGRRAVHAAHLERRWKLQKTTVNELAHLCFECHQWADNTAEGREWLKEFRSKLIRTFDDEKER